MMNISSIQKENICNILFNCGSLKENETVLIIFDDLNRDLAQAFVREAQDAAKKIELSEIPLANRHGVEPPQDVQVKMTKSHLILSLCQFSIAHTNARIKAGLNGARFLSLPCYSFELLYEPALGIDFKAHSSVVTAFANAFTHGRSACVSTESGTDISMIIEGRTGNACSGFVEGPGDFGSPPDIEANIAPIEQFSEGRIVVDGSIACPEIGLLATPVSLNIHNGKIDSIESLNGRNVDLLNHMLGDVSSSRRVLAECGVGLNPMAHLTGNMLTDEGTLGCIHFGFGSNSTIGGINHADFHLDFIIRNASLKIDDMTVLKKGKILL